MSDHDFYGTAEQRPASATAPTRVVNLDDEPFDVYIGRAGRGFDGTFGNPFRVGRLSHDGERAVQLARFTEYFYRRLREDAAFLSVVSALKGKRLGCFCRPPEGFRGRLLCHGQIIAGWLDGRRPENIE